MTNPSDTKSEQSERFYTLLKNYGLTRNNQVSYDYSSIENLNSPNADIRAGAIVDLCKRIDDFDLKDSAKKQALRVAILTSFIPSTKDRVTALAEAYGTKITKPEVLAVIRIYSNPEISFPFRKTTTKELTGFLRHEFIGNEQNYAPFAEDLGVLLNREQTEITGDTR